MAEVSEALRKKMLSLFKTKRETDAQISAFRRKLDAKKATQADVSLYSARLGELARDTIREVLTPDQLPNETLYFNILMDTVDPLMRSAHNLVNRTAAEAQKIIDEANGLGLNAVEAPYPHRRVRDLLFKAGDPELDLAAKMRLLDEPIVTLTQAFYDDHVRVNAEERFRAGMAPKIVRTASFKCCDWCASLDGTYDYEDVSNTGNDVFRRHECCRCTVAYYCDGDRTEVWGRKHWERDIKALEERKGYHVDMSKAPPSEEELRRLEENAIRKANSQTLLKRERFHTSTGDTSPDTLQMRSEFGLETRKVSTEDLKVVSSRGKDVTSEYWKKACPGVGSITEESGFLRSERTREVKTAELLLQQFGGNIKLLADNNKEERPDYLWEAKLWELKNPSSYNAVNKRVRKGLSQIHDNPGGIIVDLESHSLDLQSVIDTIDDRIRQSKGKGAVDIIIMRDSRVLLILRYE